MHRYALGQLPPAEREWLIPNTNVAKTGGSVASGPRVLCRERAESWFSALFVTALLGIAAVVLILVAGNHLRQGSFGIPPTGLLTYGAGIALGLNVLIWRTRATIAALTCPYVPMWIVTNEALLRVTPTQVKVWELEGLDRLVLHLNKGGASLSGSYRGGERLYVNFGMPLLGGQSWADANALVRAIDAALPSAGRLTLFASVPEDAATRDGRRRLLALYGATAVLSIALVFILGYTNRQQRFEQSLQEEKSFDAPAEKAPSLDGTRPRADGNARGAE